MQPAVENSSPDTQKLVTDLFNDVANSVLLSLNLTGYKEEELKKILLDTIPFIEDQQLDTEDFEFCYELLFVLSEIAGVKIQKEIDDQHAYKLSPEAILDYIKRAGLYPRDLGL